MAERGRVSTLCQWYSALAVRLRLTSSLDIKLDLRIPVLVSQLGTTDRQLHSRRLPEGILAQKRNSAIVVAIAQLLLLASPNGSRISDSAMAPQAAPGD